MKIAIPVVDLNLKRNRIAGGLNVIGQICIYDLAKQEGIWMKTLDLAPNMGELLPALERHKNTCFSNLICVLPKNNSPSR